MYENVENVEYVEYVEYVDICRLCRLCRLDCKYIYNMNTTILNDWAGHLCGVKSQPTILGGSLNHMVNIYIYTYHVQYHSIYISNVIYLFISISTPEVPLNEHAKLA